MQSGKFRVTQISSSQSQRPVHIRWNHRKTKYYCIRSEISLPRFQDRGAAQRRESATRGNEQNGSKADGERTEQGGGGDKSVDLFEITEMESAVGRI